MVSSGSIDFDGGQLEELLGELYPLASRPVAEVDFHVCPGVILLQDVRIFAGPNHISTEKVGEGAWENTAEFPPGEPERGGRHH